MQINNFCCFMAAGALAPSPGTVAAARVPDGVRQLIGCRRRCLHTTCWFASMASTEALTAATATYTSPDRHHHEGPRALAAMHKWPPALDKPRRVTIIRFRTRLLFGRLHRRYSPPPPPAQICTKTPIHLLIVCYWSGRLRRASLNGLPRSSKIECVIDRLSTRPDYCYSISGSQQ
jgi:hypothetical protein